MLTKLELRVDTEQNRNDIYESIIEDLKKGWDFNGWKSKERFIENICNHNENYPIVSFEIRNYCDNHTKRYWMSFVRYDGIIQSFQIELIRIEKTFPKEYEFHWKGA